MGYISKIFGEGKIESVKLEENVTDFKGIQRTLGNKIKAMNPQVAFEELEMAFKTDAINFNAINKSVQMIMSGGFKNFIHKNKRVIEKYRKFFEEIGYVGKDTTFEELLESIFRCQMVYGNAFVELIFNEEDTEIVDLAMIDPKKIDYAKTEDNKIILDRDGKPIGYVIKLEQGTYAEGDEIPKDYENRIKVGSQGIFILAKRICHFKLYTIGDEFYGIGLLEAAYRSVIYKKNIEKGQANSIYARGFSPLVAFVGNERRMATPKDIEGVLEKLKRLNYQRYESFPDWVKLQAIEMNNSDLTTTALKDLRTDQIASLSAPEALVSGSGEATNRATLGDQRILWEFTLKDIIKKTISYFKKYILKALDKYNGYGGVPDIEWGELRAEDIDVTCDKIIRMLTAKNLHASQQMINDLEIELRQLMNVKEYPKKGESKETIVEIEKQINDIKKKKEEEAMQTKDIKNNLLLINKKLADNFKRLEELEFEKKKLEEKHLLEIKNIQEKNVSDNKQKELELNEKNKEFEEKLKKLVEDINLKINEKDKIIDSLNKEMVLIKGEEKIVDEKMEQLIKEENLKTLERKKKLIEKLEKGLKDDK